MSWLQTTLLGAGDSGTAVLWTFLIYMVGVFAIAGMSNRLLKGRNFLSEYFLGSRGLGVWAFALTLAATSSSGGSFMGFPSKIYTHGWSLGLWIGSYMVVPICVMGLLGKRMNEVARTAEAITIPDVLRDRFRSVAFGLIAVSLIVFFMTFNLIAQFKGGSTILKTLLGPIDAFTSSAASLPDWVSSLCSHGNEYLLCLVVFGVAVIVYTTYGGFHAVVWTDVMQGVVMVVGVLIMLPLAIQQAGSVAKTDQGAGLEQVTRAMAKMVPPRKGTATLTAVNSGQDVTVPSGSWIFLGTGTDQRLLKIKKRYDLTPSKSTAKEVEVWEIVTPADIVQVRRRLADGREPSNVTGLVKLEINEINDYAYGAKPDQSGSYVTGPGPHRENSDGFMPLSLAISFFFMWAISGTGQPSNMVRLMAFKDTVTLRRSIFTVAMYYTAIYFPLVIIFCCARVLMPGMESEPDRIMPQMAVELTQNIGMGWLAGLLIAAPFAAVMSTVDSFLLMISSALVRDIYQRNINPDAEEKKIKTLSYVITMVAGIGALFGAMNPPEFLQDIIVYTGSGLAACFLAAVVYALYWPRSNAQGCIAAMVSGFAAHLSLYLVGFFQGNGFSPYRPFSIDPIIIGLVTSFAIGYVVTIRTPPPPADLVKKYFHEAS
jgi:sodium/pantothenate symporter